MIQTTPAQCQLRHHYRGLPLGYRVLRMDGTEFSPFTTHRVVEVVPGHYVVLGGIQAPYEGGSIIWGEADRDILPWVIESAAPVPVDYTSQLASIGKLIGELVARPTPDKNGYGLDKFTMKRIGEMVREAVQELDDQRLRQATEQMVEQFGEVQRLYGERISHIQTAFATQIAEQATIAEAVLSNFDNTAELLRHTATELAMREFVPPIELERLRTALGEFVEAMSAPTPDEVESVAMMEAAARILARGEV